MNVFWLCNVELPVISESRGCNPLVFGGWLDQASEYISKDNDLTVFYMAEDERDGRAGTIRYHGFTEDRAEKVLDEELSRNSYDIYHIWGTEYLHSYYCLNILKEKGLINRSVVSIQGLLQVYKRYYLEGLPHDVITKRIRKGFRLSNSIEDGYRDFDYRSQFERNCIYMSKNVIGRTEWDKNCVSSMNPEIRYFKCNENLRKCFYEGQWNINGIERHTIFVSQCSYPIKGMHYALEALRIIIDRYPDARIVTTGNDFTKEDGGQDPYLRYLTDMINKNGLNGHIVFMGRLSAEEMKARYLRSHVFLSASTIENSPNSVGEAMMLGCPVVSSFVGGVMDMMDHRKEGLLFQSGSIETMAGLIMDIFSNDELAVSLSKMSRQRAMETHNVEKNNGKLMEIYSEIKEDE